MLDEADPNVRTVAVFQNGRSQAIRIPKEMEFEGKEVLVAKQGGGLVIEPKTGRRSLEEVLARLRAEPPIRDDEWPDLDVEDSPAEDVDL